MKEVLVLITKKFYFPLLCRLADEDCWEGIEVSNSYISEIESKIAEDLKKIPRLR